MSQPVITEKNAAALVKIYYESQSVEQNGSAYGKYTIQFYKSVANHEIWADKEVLKSLNDIFWSIRLISDTTGKYDYDDLEFHAKNNAIFAEIELSDEDDGDEEKGDSDRPTHPNQVRLLEQAIQAYTKK